MNVSDMSTVVYVIVTLPGSRGRKYRLVIAARFKKDGQDWVACFNISEMMKYDETKWTSKWRERVTGST